MIRYKIDVCEALKEAGYTSTKLRKGNQMASATWTKLNRQEPVSMQVLETVCHLLHKRPCDLIEFING